VIRVLFVGDGERDAAMLPALFQGILGVETRPETRIWKEIRLSSGGGFSKKLQFSILAARDRKLQGVVATVDRDKAPGRSRLAELKKGRDADRTKHAPIPTALGEAVPHGEAWLLDDAVAVRTVLALPEVIEIPPKEFARHPQKAIEKLISISTRRDERPREICAEIAKHIEHTRCHTAKETGFAGFVDDVRAEFREWVPKGK